MWIAELSEPGGLTETKAITSICIWILILVFFPFLCWNTLILYIYCTCLLPIINIKQNMDICYFKILIDYSNILTFNYACIFVGNNR